MSNKDALRYGDSSIWGHSIAHFIHGREQTVVLDGASSPSALTVAGVPPRDSTGARTVPGLHVHQRPSHEPNTLPSQTLRWRMHSVQEHQMPTNYKKIWTVFKTGSKPGWCSSIQTNANSCESPTRITTSRPSTRYPISLSPRSTISNTSA